MCNGSSLCPKLSKHLYGQIWRERYLPIYQRQSRTNSEIYWWHLFHLGRNRRRTEKISLMKSIKSILPLNLIKSIQNWKYNSSTFYFTKMNNRVYTKLYLIWKQMENLIIMPRLNIQCYSKKYSSQSNTANSSVIVKYCMRNLQNRLWFVFNWNRN